MHERAMTPDPIPACAPHHAVAPPFDDALRLTRAQLPCRRMDYDHGDRCDCLLLATATGGGRKTIDFSYCVNVLQKHWQLRCNHGSHGSTPSDVSSGERWHEVGHLDGIKAILIREA